MVVSSRNNDYMNTNKINFNHVLLFFLIASLFLCSCDPRFGFPESMFTLAKESRLPKWYIMPANYSRTDLTIEIFYYLYATKIVTYGPNHQKLGEQIGSSRQHPFSEAKAIEARKKGEYSMIFPNYHIITVNGISEVFEHRDSNGPKAYLYVTDDPKLTADIQQKK